MGSGTANGFGNGGESAQARGLTQTQQQQQAQQQAHRLQQQQQQQQQQHYQGGNEMAGAMPGAGPNQPHATEYTLQGVMRFLQTEWHRHERDRNAWEIERQEMKGRIATLEGQARRADATQKALKKYVTILQNKIRDHAAHPEAGAGQGADDEHATKESQKTDRASMLKEKLRALENPFPDGSDPDMVEDEAQRGDLRMFLDQCHSEFAYLMVTPANPLPPRESPQLPSIEELQMRENEMANLSTSHPGGPSLQQRHDLAHMNTHLPQEDTAGRPFPGSGQGPNHHPPNRSHPPVHHHQVIAAPQPRLGDTQPMVRSGGEHSQGMYGGVADWPGSAQKPGDDTSRQRQQQHQQQQQQQRGQSHAGERAILERDNTSSISEATTKVEPVDGEAWELEFPQPGTSQQQQTGPDARSDTDAFPAADNLSLSPNRHPPRRRGSMSRRRSNDHDLALSPAQQQPADGAIFKLRFALRGHLSTVRTVIFSGGGSPGEPEICTAGDDGTVKRFHIPRVDSHSYDHHPRSSNMSFSGGAGADLDVQANFTHRGHSGAVLCLTSWSPSPNFSTGGRAQGDGWIFSGGQDATIRVWERGRVDPKATLEGHADAVWALCVLPTTLGAIFGLINPHGAPDRILLVSGSADGTVRLWAISAPPQLTSPQPGTKGATSSGAAPGRRTRGNSTSSGSGFNNSPQPTTASSSPCNHTLVHEIRRADQSTASPTCIAPLGTTGETFVVAYADAAVVVFDARSGEQVGNMDSLETYDGTRATGVNAVVATAAGLDQGPSGGTRGEEERPSSTGPTGGRSAAGSGVEGTIISGHEDKYVRFFDANSGQCTYNMLVQPGAALSSLSLSPDGRELVSADHESALRFWSLETRLCFQTAFCHRAMRGEGVCTVVWSQDGRWVVSGGGDGVVNVFTRWS